MINNTDQLKIKSWKLVSALLLVSCFLLSNPASAQTPKVPKNSGGVDSDAIKRLFYNALLEKTAERNTQAIEMFNQILAIDASNDVSMYELANIKKQQNKFTEAQPLLEKAVTINPNNEWYWSSLADIYEKNNDITKLENVFNQLIRINPDKIEYYYDKANTYALESKYDAALKVYDQIEQITGPSEELIINKQKIYLKQGKVDKAAEGLEQMIAANPNQVKYYLLLSEIYTSNNANDKAFKILDKAKSIDPNNPLIHLALADNYREKKNIDASFKELQLAFALPDLSIDQEIRIVMGYLPKFPDVSAKASALELSRIIVTAHPNDAKAYALYGDMLLQNEKYNEAKTNYKRSVELNGQIYEVREQLVRLELSNGEIDNVIKDGETALSFFPNQGWMNYFVGLAWLQKKEYKKASGYLKNVAAVEFQDKELLSLSYSALGDYYHETQSIKSSDDAYDKSLSYNADNKYTLNNYAYYLSIRGEQLDKAARMAKHANELELNNAAFEDTYAWILFKQKNYKEAKVWMEKALAHGKSKSAVQTEHYGDILFCLGDAAAAVQYWKKAKEYGAHSPVLDRKIDEKKYIE
ncbi:tetratricopeptide repeat protein [Mucilaginibacter sp.]|uniref:tetratricopeptide repeat protein n=1 Tax=Mucilaginibacter sp. TaxID=1882438 RepID=UPI0026192C32|nr:tetratricopeptide repeat protein [Mucilaginibacter sp.]MDB4925740.1 Tetratricopeptide repeat-containing protein [Mucilaginibacter sp.]